MKARKDIIFNCGVIPKGLKGSVSKTDSRITS